MTITDLLSVHTEDQRREAILDWVDPDWREHYHEAAIAYEFYQESAPDLIYEAERIIL